MSKRIYTRRKFIQQVALSASALAVPGVMAEELTVTPRQTAGPFYPDNLPLDTDNDLVVINNSLNPGVGEITHLTGRVLDKNGEPIRNAMVEIWQVDATGVYIHSKSPNRANYDTNFQGFGKFLTGSKGEYYFRTIKPVAYSDRSVHRTPHIHMSVAVPGEKTLITQCYIKGDKMNAKDQILQGIKDKKARESTIIPFKKVSGSKIGELAANFDVVMGFTPEA
jgi:protocatechuate 3,4-dioxygenase beta subunit